MRYTIKYQFVGIPVFVWLFTLILVGANILKSEHQQGYFIGFFVTYISALIVWWFTKPQTQANPKKDLPYNSD